MPLAVTFKYIKWKILIFFVLLKKILEPNTEDFGIILPLMPSAHKKTFFIYILHCIEDRRKKNLGGQCMKEKLISIFLFTLTFHRYGYTVQDMLLDLFHVHISKNRLKVLSDENWQGSEVVSIGRPSLRIDPPIFYF